MANSITSALPRTFPLAAIAAGLLLGSCPAGAAGQSPVVLENEHLRLEVDSGVLQAHDGRWEEGRQIYRKWKTSH
jgi:hypothetical protein